MQNISVDTIKKVLKAKDDADLAVKLGYKSQGTISNWKKNGIPAKALMKIIELTDGIIQIKGNNNQINCNEFKSSEERVVLEMMSHWDTDKRRKLLKMALAIDE